jgi:hypothetical protein
MPKDLNDKKVNRAGRVVEAAQHLRAGLQGFQAISSDMSDGLDFAVIDTSGSPGTKHVDATSIALVLEAATAIETFVNTTKLSDGSTIKTAIAKICPS